MTQIYRPGYNFSPYVDKNGNMTGRFHWGHDIPPEEYTGKSGTPAEVAAWLHRIADDIAAAGSLPRTCYYIAADQSAANGYIPSIVTEGQPGHAPLAGRSPSQVAPWYWGKDYATALKVCAEQNERIGLSADDVREIIRSSMFPGYRKGQDHGHAH